MVEDTRTAPEVGDVVTLKSGGAPMTLIGFEPGVPAAKGFATEKTARCVWMLADGSVDEKLFWPHCLVVKQSDRPAESRVDLVAEYDDNSSDQSKWSPEKTAAEANRQHADAAV